MEPAKPVFPVLPFGLYKAGSASNRVPLTSIDYDISIINSLAKIYMTMKFTNFDAVAPIECEYVFPIDYQMALTEMTVRTSCSTIESKILPIEEASIRYNDAIASGKTAYKLDYDLNQPDLLTMRVGNLQPMEEVTITTTYVKACEIEDNAYWSFRLPLTFFPRFDSEEICGIIPGEKPASLSHSAAFFEYLYTMKTVIVLNGQDADYVLSEIKANQGVVTLGPDMKTATIVSATHSITSEELSQDLVLKYKLLKPNTVSTLIQASPNYANEYSLMLAFIPPIVPCDNFSQEYLFLLDCSGSMGEQKMETAKSALRMFLRSLPVESRFNIICFGTDHKLMSPESVDYNQKSLLSALQYILGIKSNMGGTDIEGVLRNTLVETTCLPGYPKVIFLLTDGAVSNPLSCIDLVKKNAAEARVFALGIGAGASRSIVKGCALAGNGDFGFAGTDEDLTPKVVSLLEKACKPCLCEATIEFPKDIEIIYQLTAKLPSIYLNEPALFYAIFKCAHFPASLSEKTITLKYTNNYNYEENTHVIPAFSDKHTLMNSGTELYQLTMTHYLNKHPDMSQREKTELSLKYSVLSDATCFYACHKLNERHGGKAEAALLLKKVPIQISRPPSYKIVTRTSSKSGKHGAAKVLESVVNIELLAEKQAEAEEQKKKLGGKVEKAKKLYEAVAEAQEFTGVWKGESCKILLSDHLTKIWTKISYELILQLTIAGPSPLQLPSSAEFKKITDIDVLFTILCLHTLESQCQKDRASWNLIYKKGLNWLKSKGVEYAAWVGEMKKVLDMAK